MRRAVLKGKDRMATTTGFGLEQVCRFDEKRGSVKLM